jgi:hypothetical protein
MRRPRPTRGLSRQEKKKSEQTIIIDLTINTRPVRKPRTRWEDVVRRDTTQILIITGWKRRTEGREE